MFIPHIFFHLGIKVICRVLIDYKNLCYLLHTLKLDKHHAPPFLSNRKDPLHSTIVVNSVT